MAMGPRRFLLPILLGILVAVAGFYLLRTLEAPSGLQRTADPPALLKEIQRLQQLATVKYAVQKVVGLEEAKFPVGSEKILLIVQAWVTAGIDLEELSPDALEVNGEEVLVRLPDPQILNVSLDEKETRVWDRQITWWTPWVPFNNDLERRARIAAIDSIRESALEMGILDQAEQNAETTIRALLITLGFKRVLFRPLT